MLRAIGKNILVEKPPLQTQRSEGGIVIPQSLLRTPRFAGHVRARVVSVGGRVREWAAGDTIIMRAEWGDDYFYDGRTITILDERASRDCLRAD